MKPHFPINIVNRVAFFHNPNLWLSTSTSMRSWSRNKFPVCVNKKFDKHAREVRRHFSLVVLFISKIGCFLLTKKTVTIKTGAWWRLRPVMKYCIYSCKIAFSILSNPALLQTARPYEEMEKLFLIVVSLNINVLLILENVWRIL